MSTLKWRQITQISIAGVHNLSHRSGQINFFVYSRAKAQVFTHSKGVLWKKWEKKEIFGLPRATFGPRAVCCAYLTYSDYSDSGVSNFFSFCQTRCKTNVKILFNDQKKIYLISVVTCWAVADGQASADKVVLDVDDQKCADGANDLFVWEKILTSKILTLTRFWCRHDFWAHGINVDLHILLRGHP
jgi:hypothetical protein